ncbi:MAG: tetratricopeptide repeat protein [bacterium]
MYGLRKKNRFKIDFAIYLMFAWWLLNLAACRPFPDVDCIVVHSFQLPQTQKASDLFEPEMLEYLIAQNLVQSSNEVVLTGKEFKRLNQNVESVKMQIQGTVTAEDAGYKITLKLLQPDEEAVIITHDFAHSSMLLTDSADRIIRSILEELGVAAKKKSVFTRNWQAFKHFFAGETAREKLNSKSARQQFQQAVELDPGFVLAKLYLAEALIQDGRADEAEGIVQSTHPFLSALSRQDSLTAELLSARIAGDTKKEIDIAQKIYRQNPNRKRFAFLLAEVYFERCDIKNALKYCKKALQLDRYFARAHNQLGYCYSHLGKHNQALHHFRTHVQLDSTARAFSGLADGYLTAGLLDSAAWAIEQGLRLEPGGAYLYGSLCLIQIEQGKIAQAQESAENYLRYASDSLENAKGYFYLALVKYFQRDYVSALNFCMKSKNWFDGRDLITRNHDAHWLMGVIYAQTGVYARAQKELTDMEAIIQSNKINADNYRKVIYKYMLHLKACLAAKLGQIGPVLKIIKKFDGAIKMKIKDHDSPFDLAFFNTSFGKMFMEFKINRLDLAEARFKKALEYNSNYVWAHYHLWKLYRKAHTPEKARQALNKLQDLWHGAEADFKKIYDVPDTPSEMTKK